MLAQRIIDTLRFFDLQQLPLTAFEIHKYLLTDSNTLRSKLDEKFEFSSSSSASPQTILPVSLDTVLTQLYILGREGKIEENKGFYCLPGRKELIDQRLVNYLNGIPREKLIRRYLMRARHLPFVRGIALAGSQALGQQRAESDIDLLILTDSDFLWTARTVLSLWFQIFGVRRHGNKIANRFCLNHYLAGIKKHDSERNLYTALEYAKLRPVVYSQAITQYQRANKEWINQFFPNAAFDLNNKKTFHQSSLQKVFEKLLRNSVGIKIESWLGKWQLRRVRQDQFVFVRDDELSFHPDSKQQSILQKFFTA